MTYSTALTFRWNGWIWKSIFLGALWSTWIISTDIRWHFFDISILTRLLSEMRRLRSWKVFLLSKDIRSVRTFLHILYIFRSDSLSFRRASMTDPWALFWLKYLFQSWWVTWVASSLWHISIQRYHGVINRWAIATLIVAIILIIRAPLHI